MSTNTKTLVYCAVFIAIAVTVSYVSGFFDIVRVSLTPVVIMFAGVVLGPVLGGVAGGVTDIVSFMIKPTGVYFPGFLLTMTLYGVLGGLFFHNREERALAWPQIAWKVVVIQTVCSAFLNTLWLTIMTETSFSALLATRLPNTYISCAVYVALLCILVRSRKRIARGVA